jgi:ATP-dependent Clp protease, protease subunit
MPNELYIYDVIGESFFESGVTDKSVRDELKKFKNTEPLDVRINSPGGSVFHAVAIFTMLSQWKGHVNIQIDGLAASAASYIAMAGDNVTMAEGGMLMIHNPWSMAVGNAEDMRKAADMLDKVGGNLVKAYVARTGKSADDIASLMEAETWLSVDEALEHGFIHAKIEERAAAFVIPIAMGFRHPPEQTPQVEPKQRSVNSIAAMQRRIDLARACV